MKFAKPALSIADQIALVERRGMVIPDRARAEHYLKHISYYRLRAYWLPFEQPAPVNGDHMFRAGTSFEDALALLWGWSRPGISRIFDLFIETGASNRRAGSLSAVRPRWQCHNWPGLNVIKQGWHRTSSTFIRFEHPVLPDLATIIPFAAGSTFERAGPISKSGVFQPVRVSVTRPPGFPPTRSGKTDIRR